MRGIGYVRVSTAVQAEEGASLTAQRRAIEVAAEERGITLLRVIEDAGKSAKNLKRPGVREALEILSRGEADVLLVAKLDRFTRSLQDFANTLASAKDQGWSLIALDLGLDMTNHTGRLIASFMASLAQWQREDISERTREGLAIRRKEGIIGGRKDGVTSDLKLRMIRERKEGKTLREIAVGLDREQILPPRGQGQWSLSTISGIITRAVRH